MMISLYNIGYRGNLTVDAAQGQEAHIVVVLLMKPSSKLYSLGFHGNANRVNVAPSRAKKIMVIIRNLST
jgi:superfamily I DNA and/or RNA helicase